MSNYVRDEHGNLVVELKYSEVKQITLQEPKGKHIRAIQSELNRLGTADEMTAVAVAMKVLTVEPKLTLEQIDEFDAEDFVMVGEALNSFRFFANSLKRRQA